ncbi:hypothetical protein U1Q18_028240, partial [Sarracenia purpurea var. burkii]
MPPVPPPANSPVPIVILTPSKHLDALPLYHHANTGAPPPQCDTSIATHCNTTLRPFDAAIFLAHAPPSQP